MPVGREPGDSTMIRVHIETKGILERLKLADREAIGDVVKRLVLEHRKLIIENAELKKQLSAYQPVHVFRMPSTSTGLDSPSTILHGMPSAASQALEKTMGHNSPAPSTPSTDPPL